MLCLLGGNRAWADYLYLANNWTDNTDDYQNPCHNIVITRGATDTENTEYTIKLQLKYWSSGGKNANVNNDFTWYNNNFGDVSSEKIVTDNNRVQIKVKGKGGAVVIDTNGTTSYNNQYYHTFCVITLPPLDNYVWDFYKETVDKAENNINFAEDYKFKPESGDNKFKIYLANPNDGNSHICGSHTKIDGTNAYYIHSTAGMVFNTENQYFGYYPDDLQNHTIEGKTHLELVTFGGNHYNDANKKPQFTLPQVKGGKYIKVWWNAVAGGNNGGHFSVTNLMDLEGKSIDNSFVITGVTYYGDCLGCLVFKVKGNPSERKDVTFTLEDNGWNDLYKIEITDEYSTDMELNDITNAAWNVRHYVKYNNQFASIVHDGNGTNKLYSGTPGPVYIQRGRTCEFEVTPEGGVTIDNVYEESTGANNAYRNLKLTGIKGTGNIKIVMKEIIDGYVLDKNETWVAVGEYKQQTYPYTWDFTDYNVSQGNLYAWLSGSNTYGSKKYGHWIAQDSETYKLETAEPVDASKISNNQPWMSEKIVKPLFAQGAQLTYWKQDGSIGTVDETEGLRVKQAYGTKGDLAVGDEYDGELSIDGKCLKYTPASEWSRLHITIPQVDAGMYVFVKADDGTADENYANPSVKIGDTDLTIDESYNTKKKVRAYKVTTKGDVDITFSKTAIIKAIGVTNIFKSINALGYATESRNHAIDHVYEGEFTKNDVNAYCIQTYADEGFTYEYKGLPQVKKSQVMNVIPKNTGIVLYKENHTGGSFSVPLFYPACNAKVRTAEQLVLDNNWMAPWVNAEQHYNDQIQKEWAMHRYDDNANDYKDKGEWCQKFVMSSKFYVYHKTGDGTGSYSSLQTSTDPTSGEPAEAFYRMNLNLANTGVSGTSNVMGANKAYLLIPSSKMPKALWNDGDGNGNAGSSKNGIIFMDLEDIFGPEDLSGVATSIDAIESADSVDNGNTYYTLSGMKIQGRPTEKGVYIMNGKKVLVK